MDETLNYHPQTILEMTQCGCGVIPDYGVCHNLMQEYDSLFKCSNCGWECADMYSCDSPFKCCPNCCRKVVQ